ncbi:MAG: DM13 domain-containing protein [Elainellaceae cyanobacterium]
MKLTYLTALVISSALSFGAVALVADVQPAQANPCASVNPCAANPCAANPCAANPCAANPCAANPCAANPCAGAAVATSQSGAFQGVDHPTLGTATVVEVGGKRYLEFDDAFQSDDGPDLFVLLHKEAVPQGYDSSQFVNLGVLKSTEGSQRYEIPEGISVEDFASAVIWCREFNVTFGFATL